MSAPDKPGGRRTGAEPPADAADGAAGDAAPTTPTAPTFDRHLVLDQLGGWRGMVDATLPTLAFIVANSVGGLRPGIWAAIGAALLVFLVRLVRRQSVQQAVGGLFGVAIAVAIAAASGQARDYFVPGIIRNTAIAAVLFGSVALRRPIVGYAAEFLAPSHLGTLASSTLPGMRRRIGDALHHRPATDPLTGRRAPDPAPERHWRDDPRMVRAYGWLTVLWGTTFALRVAVQTPLYLRDEVGLLGTVSIVLGLPVTAVALVVTFWVVARLHRHRSEDAPAGSAPAADDGRELPAA